MEPDSIKRYKEERKKRGAIVAKLKLVSPPKDG
jgi:hypothetical protein